MKIAVIGCSHGELDRIYEDISRIETEKQITIDLVIICGDFQAVRNEHDLQCMAVPHKYRQLQTFHKYYSSESTAPKLTLFIGGNHEASNYLQSVAYGGWVATNIYYLGYASVVRFKGLRIAGISGIHHRNDSNCGHFERLPFDENTKRSVYHMRQTDVYKFMQLTAGSDDSPQSQQLLDVIISHDWPINIHSCGDVQYLLRRKPFFRNEVQSNRLGNPLLEPLVRHLKPKHWFSAHLHVRFEALVNHSEDNQIQTKFLALDKVLPKRQYLEIIDIEPTVPSESDCFEYDAEWLAILKKTDKLLSIERKCSVPQLWSRLHSVDESDINKVKELFNNDLKIPNNFQMTEPALNGRQNDSDPQRIRNHTNPQTTEFCEKLGITDPIAAIIDSMKVLNPDQISISDDEEEPEEKLEESEQIESSQKRQKKDDNIDGGDLFFVDKGGDESKGDKITDSFAKGMESNTETMGDRPEEVCSGVTSDPIMSANPTQTLTKRQLKRRADKLKRQSELRQLEKSDAVHKPNPHIEKKKANKQEIRRVLEERRKLILNRLEWAKTNLPMLSPDSEVTVITEDQFKLDIK